MKSSPRASRTAPKSSRASAGAKSTGRTKASPSGGAKAARGSKAIYYFGRTRCDGTGDMKSLLGGKGANLAKMTSIGLPVPPGFTITTEQCIAFASSGGKMPAAVLAELDTYVRMLEKEVGKRFGDRTDPLLVSVRSGARDSMPGMMDTILNLGLNDVTVEALAAATGNPRFAWDCYRRFVQMYGDVV
ncbi:MAG: pyruvate, phosphate dikinase, partial [Phycisphaerales bacterium]|nr:pyruvate, phosphate dikinase [Phycisphaerales bacterium]